MAPENQASGPGLGSETDPLKLIDSLTRNADALQSEVLSAILTLNAGTEYLNGLGVSGCTDRNTFKSLAPVLTYEDIRPYIQRIANGDKSPILCANPISEFVCSSGTSGGQRKLIPVDEDDFMRRAYFYNVVTPAIKKHFVDGLDDGKGLHFSFVKPELRTPGGLVATTVTTRFVSGKHFLHGMGTGKNPYTSPLEATLCQDVVQSMYSQLICGLVQRAEVTWIGAFFASAFLRVIKFMCERWEDLEEDIRQRKLVSGVVTDVNLRNVVECILATSEGAGEGAAAEINSQFQKGNCQGILRRIWPNAKYVDTILTGSMEQYVSALELFAGGIPLVSSTYTSSECHCGINLTPFCPPSSVCYTVLPNMAFFEFLDLSEKQSKTKLMDLVDVQLGKEYELVVTTFTGLYRYRMGDVLKVEGFHNKAPQFSFVCRKDAVLAVDMDKTDESDLLRAIKTATSKHLEVTGCRPVEFSSFVDVSSIPGHYVLFWELTQDANTSGENSHSFSPTFPKSSVFEDCCLTIENCLDAVYRQGRVCNNSIGPLEIRLVKAGTFDSLMDYCVARGASLGQYKSPICVKPGPLVDLLNSKVTHCFFSPGMPHLDA